MIDPTNRIASITPEGPVKWPARSDHQTQFQALLGNAYAQSIKSGHPIAFIYISQTSPEPTMGLMTAIALAHPMELPVAIENLVKTAKNAGQIADAALVQLATNIMALVPTEGGETCGPSDPAVPAN